MNPRRGFTLVETLVAITVLVLGVTAPLTLGSQGLTASRVARDQVVATYLIQEAIEYIRNTRDTNALSGTSWLSGLSECTTGGCRIDVPADAVESCSGTCPALDYNDGTGLYGYNSGSGWEPTKLLRTVALEETVPGIEAKITVTVAWQDGLAGRTITTDEHLLNWQ
ncbi:MAG TPA: prepilin-type N-terminal cleavage/methylation domain-containing protein [Candidatus Paceibacterota bacterium]|nr:prepilin-type N-terminal cleavage/methylation domain-containing protein [Candidatus Paceibacterota bacterium]